LKRFRSVLVLAALAAPAMAGDDPTPPAPPAPAPTPAPADGEKTEPAPAPAPAAKKERRVDEAGTKALARHNAMVRTAANAGAKSVSAKGKFEQMMFSCDVEPTWTPEQGLDVKATLSEDAKAMFEAQGATEEQIAEVTKGMGMQIARQLGVDSVFEPMGKTWAHFDVAAKQSGEDTVVELTPFDDQAEAESLTYTFGGDGLLRSASLMPKPNPRAPQMAGMPIEVSFKFEKQGDRHAIVERIMTIMGMELASRFEYFADAGAVPLLKSITMSTPQGDASLSLHDYVVDGKPVESTKSAAATTPAKPLEKSEEKPSAEPPAPPAPAPTDDAK
jgi:hypothetical protein